MSIKKDGCDLRQDRTAATTAKHSEVQCLKHFRVYHKSGRYQTILERKNTYEDAPFIY